MGVLQYRAQSYSTVLKRWKDDCTKVTDPDLNLPLASKQLSEILKSQESCLNFHLLLTPNEDKKGSLILLSANNLKSKKAGGPHVYIPKQCDCNDDTADN